ncbi:ARMC1 protein, partial [Amia calva]|nr:ARMC1 protein [Amia calva]
MSVEPDALAVVNQLRDLAADPLNRRAIVQDQGCLPGLILFLDHPNPQVVYSALLAVRYLAECRANREKMKSELGMMLSLQNVMQKDVRYDDIYRIISYYAISFISQCRKFHSLRQYFSSLGRTTTPGETKLLASEIYEILQSSSSAEGGQAEEATSCRRKAQFFLGTTNKRAKTVVLHIDGLDDAVTIDRLSTFSSFCALGTAIASTKVMKAQQVVKSEDGDEVMIPFQEDAPVEVEQITDLPDYLPEEESPSKEQDKAVSRVGSKTDGSGWLNTAANFLSRSFYW